MLTTAATRSPHLVLGHCDFVSRLQVWARVLCESPHDKPIDEKRALSGNAVRDEVREQLFYLFARVDVLMLKPITGHVLRQSNQRLPQKFRIGTSDFATGDAFFQQGPQGGGALVTGPDRERSDGRLDIAQIAVVEEAAFGLFDEIEIGIQRSIEALPYGALGPGRGVESMLEAFGVVDDQRDEQVFFAFEIEIEAADGEAGAFGDLFDPEGLEAFVVNERGGGGHELLPDYGIGRSEAAPLPPGLLNGLNVGQGHRPPSRTKLSSEPLNAVAFVGVANIISFASDVKMKVGIYTNLTSSLKSSSYSLRFVSRLSQANAKSETDSRLPHPA